MHRKPSGGLNRLWLCPLRYYSPKWTRTHTVTHTHASILCVYHEHKNLGDKIVIVTLTSVPAFPPKRFTARAVLAIPRAHVVPCLRLFVFSLLLHARVCAPCAGQMFLTRGPALLALRPLGRRCLSVKVSADMVKELRAATGAPMMECKTALMQVCLDARLCVRACVRRTDCLRILIVV